MKKSFQTEMDDTQQAVSQIVCLCTTIALHQEFGVGKTRLDRITDRIHDLEDQNTEVIMTPDANGRPSKARAEAIRESWLAGYVTSDYRIPMLRAPRGRKEQQYQIAGNKAARIAWQIYAKAVIDILHYGPERLERLRKESHANYEQLNQWAHEDGLDVAMEKLRRCAADAMQAPDLEVTDIDGSKDAAQYFKAVGIYWYDGCAIVHTDTRDAKATWLCDAPRHYPSTTYQKFILPTIRRGCTGDANRAATKMLQRLLGLTPDGIFGEGTENALLKAQEAHGLTVDGICGPVSWKAISGASKYL